MLGQIKIRNDQRKHFEVLSYCSDRLKVKFTFEPANFIIVVILIGD